MIKKFIIIFISVLVVCSTNGCATVYNPVTKEKELTLINTSAERSLGERINRQIENQHRFVTNSEMLSRVRRIGNALSLQSERRNIHYYFKVIDENKLNAVAIPGGYIYLYKKLVQEANNDELACVIGHEIAHVEARHGVKRLQAVLGYQLLLNLALGGKAEANIVKYSNLIFDLILKGYSREDELQADRVGVRYAYQAGYNPKAMISFLKKLIKKGRYSPSRIEFFSTHPLVENRIEELQKVIGRIKYE